MPHPQEADQPVSIVIADNDPELVRLTIDHLQQEYGAIAVSGFSDSRQAAALVVRARPSLLISSPQLPRVGGMDLITLAQKRWGQIPAIVLVDGAGLGPSGHLRASSTVTYLEKPFSPATLRHCITALIRLVPLPGETTALAAEPAQTPAAPLSAPIAADDTTHQAAADPPAATRADDAELQALESEETGKADPDPDGSEPEGSEPPHAEPEADSGPSQQEEEARRAAFQSAATFLRMASREGAYELDPSLSSVTPLPVSQPPSQEISDIWLQPSISAGGPSESGASANGELTLHDGEAAQRGERALARTATNIKENLAKLESIDGFVGAALADSENGMCLGFIGGAGIFNLEIAAAANTEVVRSKRKAIQTLNLRDEIEDILITLGKQHHLIRPVRSRPSLFYYLALDRQRANLAMARYTLAEVERELPM